MAVELIALTDASFFGVVRALMSAHAPQALEAGLDARGARRVSLAVEERKIGLDEVVRIHAYRQTDHHVILAPEGNSGR